MERRKSCAVGEWGRGVRIPSEMRTCRLFLLVLRRCGLRYGADRGKMLSRREGLKTQTSLDSGGNPAAGVAMKATAYRGGGPG